MKDYKEHIYALIFCGGGGTRLWPFSREEKPKQFLKITGDKTLVRETFERVRMFAPVERIFVVTVPNYTDEVSEILSEIPKDQVLVEPARRNTAMAAGLGAVSILKKDPKAIIVNVWSDHMITDGDNYCRAVLAGAEAASDGTNLVTTGIKPSYPHTGFGYVRKGYLHKKYNGLDVYKVDKFIEKPKIDAARKMLDEGGYLWHQGTMVWRGDCFMNSIQKYAPETYSRLEEISKLIEKPQEKKGIDEIYSSAPDLSIDVALAEKAENFLITEAVFEWHDLGDFSVLWSVSKKDEDGNAFISDDGGEWTGFETKDSMIVCEGKRMVATAGVEGIIVVSTPQAVLVVSKTEAQKVKKIVEILKEKERKDLL